MKRMIGAAVVAFALASPATNAQDSLLGYVLESCDADISAFCDQVTPGDGRLLYCMAAHEDKISSECAYALYSAATILDELTNTIVYLAESCETDIEEHCAETEMGEGRILSCLDRQRDDLTDSCRTAIDEVASE